MHIIVPTDLCFVFQGTPIKDVTISESAPKTLILQKHADYIAAYGNKKDDYVY